MRIHVVGTVNGLTNEGMRNVATHLSTAFKKNHVVRYSGLKDIAAIICNSLFSHVTLIFARANAKVYFLAGMARMLCGRVWIVCVQKPEPAFLRLCSNRPLKCGYLTLLNRDLEDLTVRKSYGIRKFSVGIDNEKFTPVSHIRARELKLKYDFSPEKRLVVHVGHCSSGRGLEDFAALSCPEIDRLVIASGMFKHEATVTALRESGVRVASGFFPNVEEVYQMADAYLFPTRSSEFVISIPLSVIEALACGTPVIAYRGFDSLREIPISNPSAIELINDKSELTAAVMKVSAMKADQSYLMEALSWDDSAEAIVRSIGEGSG